MQSEKGVLVMNDIMGEKTFNFVKFLLKSLVVLVSLLLVGIFFGIIGAIESLNSFAKAIITIISGICASIYILHTINVFNKIK